MEGFLHKAGSISSSQPAGVMKGCRNKSDWGSGNGTGLNLDILDEGILGMYWARNFSSFILLDV